jgi:formylglycine-generating enzyme required for sulfatase activity
MRRVTLFLAVVTLALAVMADGPAAATKEKPFVNSLGMKFVPVKGTDVLFSIWDTRVQDFEAFVQATGHDATKDMFSVTGDGWKKPGDNWVKQQGDTWKSPGFTQGPTHPVVGVSWEDAKAFCKWLTEKERAAGRLRAGQEYRLPTDAEWSVAVGLGPETGSTPKDKSGKIKDVYPWGTQYPPPRGAGNYFGEEAKQGWPSGWTVIKGYNDGYARTSPVGSFAANSSGLFDMGGNVWQWCEDLYEPDSERRVLRGSAWIFHDPPNLFSSFRFYGLPGGRGELAGFRCVLVVGSSSLR